MYFRDHSNAGMLLLLFYALLSCMAWNADMLIQLLVVVLSQYVLCLACQLKLSVCTFQS